MKTSKSVSGFTLLELLVVIAIIGIIAMIIIASLGSSRDKANNSKALAQISSMRTQAELYRSTYGSYGPLTGSCDEAGTLFGPGEPESLNPLVDGLGYYSGNVTCYANPDSWGVYVRGSGDNAWCVDSSSSDRVFSLEDSPLEMPAFCNSMFFY